MRVLTTRTAAALLALTTTASLAAEPTAMAEAATTAGDGATARALIGQLATRLTGELALAIRDGGPVNAVGFCQTRAPVIAAELSAASGWQVGRTSLQVRSPANAPDAWETRVLNQFQARQDAGESLQGMRYAEVVRTDSGPAYRYMQAIPVAEPCLACHGPTLAPELAEVIDKAYPDDQARGYAAGELRGAFTLQRPL
jgi:hypothetical protein